MTAISQNWLKRMAGHLKDHRRNFNEVGSWFTSIRLRHFAGHESYAEHLNSPIRVAHISDQHVGRVTPMRLQVQAIELALAQDPDIVVLTGDFVCHSELYLHDLSEVIKKIQKPVFAVLGNHDHWTNAQAVKKALRSAGAEILENSHTVIKIRHEELQVLGLDDAYTRHADIAKATKGMKKNMATLGLSHIGECADELWLKHVPLVLSGHTHGGQITIAGIHELILKKVVGHKYIHGFYGHRHQAFPKGAVYVSAGIGAAVMPLRMGEKGKREIAIFDLGLAHDSLLSANPLVQP
jgi:predicted MPP superfamily phosphohydrolase